MTANNKLESERLKRNLDTARAHFDEVLDRFTAESEEYTEAVNTYADALREFTLWVLGPRPQG